MNKQILFHKKDFILLIVLGVTVLMVDYALSWYQVYKEHNLSMPIISKYITEVTELEFEGYIKENPDAFVYFGIIDDEKSRNFENKFKKTITKYHLKDEIIYLNVKNIDFNVLFNKHTDVVNSDVKVPLIAVYKNDVVIDYIDYSNSKLKEKEIVKLLRKYGRLDN